MVMLSGESAMLSIESESVVDVLDHRPYHDHLGASCAFRHGCRDFRVNIDSDVSVGSVSHTPYRRKPGERRVSDFVAARRGLGGSIHVRGASLSWRNG